MKKLFLFAAIAAFFATSCNSSGSGVERERIVNAYILNHGSEGDMNGSISTYNFDANTCIPDAYYIANASPIGANIVDASSVISFGGDILYVLTSNPNQIIALAGISVVNTTASTTGQGIKELQKVSTTPVTEGLSNPQKCVAYVYRGMGNANIILFVVNSGDPKSTLAVYNVTSYQSMKLQTTTDLGANAHGLAIAGNSLAVTSDDGVTVFSISDGTLYKEGVYAYEGAGGNFGTPYDITPIGDDRFAVICKGRGVYTIDNSGRTIDETDAETGATPIVASDYVLSSMSNTTDNIAYAITDASGVGRAFLSKGRLDNATELYATADAQNKITGLNYVGSDLYVMDGGLGDGPTNILVYSSDGTPITTRNHHVGINSVKAIFFPYYRIKAPVVENKN